MTPGHKNIISRQAVRDAIIGYTATVFAVVASLWIYPMELDAYGMAQIMVSTATLIIPFTTFGTLAIVVKFFPQYKKEGFAASYLFNVLILCGGLFVLTSVLAWIVNDPVFVMLESLKFNTQLILEYKFLIMGFAAVILYNQALTQHISNYNRIAIPAIYNSLIPKVALPLSVLAFHFQLVNLFQFLELWLAAFVLGMIGLTVYASKIGALNLKREITFFRTGHLRDLLKYSFFVGLSNIGTVLISRIDIIMIGMLIGAKEAGVYGIALFVSNVLNIPTASIWKISSPVVSKAFDDGDMGRVERVYKKSATNLLVIGTFVYLGIYGTLDSVIHYSSDYDKLQPIFAIFAVLGLGKLFAMGTSINHQIIAYSVKYRYLLIFVLLLAFANVSLTYYFVLEIGIIGAAAATVISLSVYNLVKTLLVYRWFGMHPLSRDTFKILVLIAVATAYVLLMPVMSSPIVNIIVFSAGLTAVYAVMIKVLNIKAEIIDTLISRGSKIFSR